MKPGTKFLKHFMIAVGPLIIYSFITAMNVIGFFPNHNQEWGTIVVAWMLLYFSIAFIKENM